MNGVWKWYRVNGKLMQMGYLTMRKKTGTWKRYHPNGELYDEGNINGKKTGEKTYNTNGKLIKSKKHK